jgi:hypothetical protein
VKDICVAIISLEKISTHKLNFYRWKRSKGVEGKKRRCVSVFSHSWQQQHCGRNSQQHMRQTNCVRLDRKSLNERREKRKERKLQLAMHGLVFLSPNIHFQNLFCGARTYRCVCAEKKESAKVVHTKAYIYAYCVYFQPSLFF